MLLSAADGFSAASRAEAADMFWRVVQAIDQKTLRGLLPALCRLLPLLLSLSLPLSLYTSNSKVKSENALKIPSHHLPGLSAAKKRFALSEETDLEATTEESIECVSSSDPEKSKKEEGHSNNGKVE